MNADKLLAIIFVLLVVGLLVGSFGIMVSNYLECRTFFSVLYCMTRAL